MHNYNYWDLLISDCNLRINNSWCKINNIYYLKMSYWL